MKITITADSFEDAQYGLDTLKQLAARQVVNGSVVIKTVNGEFDFSKVAVVNKSFKGNYSAKVNQK